MTLSGDNSDEFIDFLDDLRRNGYNIGLDQYITSQRLMVALAANRDLSANADRLGNMLAAILCTSPHEQKNFYKFYNQWLRSSPGLFTQIRETEDKAATPEPADIPPVKKSERNILKPPARRRMRLKTVVAIAASMPVIYLLGYFAFFKPVPAPPLQDPIPIVPNQTQTGNIRLTVFFFLSTLISLIVAFLLARRFLRHAELKKWRTKDKPHLDKLIVKGDAERLPQILSLRRIAQELRRYRHYDAQDIDINKTVEATIRKDLFTPVHKSRKTSPEYLTLTDRSGSGDQQAQFVNEIITNLAKNDIFITHYFFQGDPRICRKGDHKAPFQSLQELAAKYSDHYLLIFSDGEGLFNPLTGRPHRWLEIFSAWPTRFLLTFDFQAGDYLELALSEFGFNVLPASKAGLMALRDVIDFGVSRKVQDRYQTKPLPPILRERPERWLESHPPSSVVLNKLCLHMKNFLGRESYYWLSACAVYPVLQWELTLDLGYKLINHDNFDEKFSTLIRLPWFRNGSMPEWLRERLIMELSTEQEQAIRKALEELLWTSRSQPEGFALPFARGPQSGKTTYLQEAWQRLKARTGELTRKGFALDDLKSEPVDSLLRDYVLLNFLYGRKPSKLALSIPNNLIGITTGEVSFGIRLSEAQLNEWYKIEELDGPYEECRRLMDLGFTPGEEIFIAQLVPFRDPLVVIARDTRFLLRRREAAWIFVQRQNRESDAGSASPTSAPTHSKRKILASSETQ